MFRSFIQNIKPRYLLWFLAAVYIVNGLIYIPQNSITGDEADHLSYAIRLVKGHPEKVKPFDDASTMPVSALNTIPRIIQQKLNPSLAKTDGGTSDIFAGRYISLFVSLLIGIFIYKWAADLYGSEAGLLGFFFFVFCPNTNAHANLVATDAYCALLTLTTAYYFQKYILLRSWRSLILFSVSLGLAQLTKQSLTHLYFLFLMLAIVIYARQHELLKKVPLKIGKILLIVLLNLLIINAGFLMNGSGAPLKAYQFRSSFFRNVQASLKPAQSVPLPLPQPYLAGLDLTKNIDEMGGGHPESSGRIYILGRSKEGSGFWYYYLVAIFFKTPIAILLAIVLLALRSLHKRFGNLTVKELIPLFTIFYLLCYFSFFYNSQVGIRHILFVYPLLYVLLSPLVYLLKKNLFSFSVFIVYTITTFYYYFPNLISYTNEFVLPKRSAYKFLADSNLDYKQGWFWMRDYLDKHPDVHQPDSLARPGKYIVSVSDYLNLSHENNFDWLRKFEPVGQVRHCNLIFDITERDLKK